MFDSLSPSFSGLVAIVVFILGGWATVRNGYNARLTHIEAQQASVMERISHVEEFARTTSDLGAQISALSAKMDDLRADVNKHNSVIERTYKLESEMDSARQQIEDLKATR